MSLEPSIRLPRLGREALGNCRSQRQQAVCTHDSSPLTVTARGPALDGVARGWACPHVQPAYPIADIGGRQPMAGLSLLRGCARIAGQASTRTEAIIPFNFHRSP